MSTGNKLRVVCGCSLAVLLLLSCLWWAFLTPEVSLHVASASQLSFAVVPSRINGIYSVAVFSDTRQEYLWIIHPRETIHKVQYGVLDGTSTQVFPENAKPKPLQPGERIIVQVAFQYDGFMTPYIGDSTYAVDIGQDGHVSDIERLQHCRLPHFEHWRAKH